jgi:hypothetical protein
MIEVEFEDAVIRGERFGFEVVEHARNPLVAPCS